MRKIHIVPTADSTVTLLDFLNALTFSRNSLSRNSDAVRVGDRLCREGDQVSDRFAPRARRTARAMNVERKDPNSTCLESYGSLPTSSFLPAAERASGAFSEDFGSIVVDFLFSTSRGESALFGRFSIGGDTEELLRLRRPAGAYLWMER